MADQRLYQNRSLPIGAHVHRPTQQQAEKSRASKPDWKLTFCKIKLEVIVDQNSEVILIS